MMVSIPVTKSMVNVCAVVSDTVVECVYHPMRGFSGDDGSSSYIMMYLKSGTVPEAVRTRSVAVRVTIPAVCSAVTPVISLVEMLVYDISVMSESRASVTVGSVFDRATLRVQVASEVKLCTPFAKFSTNWLNLFSAAMVCSFIFSFLSYDG